MSTLIIKIRFLWCLGNSVHTYVYSVKMKNIFANSCSCDTDISCPSLSAPTGGTMTCSNGESVGSKCTIACSDGYVMDGTKEMNCRSNRRWDKSSVPECRKIKSKSSDIFFLLVLSTILR